MPHLKMVDITIKSDNKSLVIHLTLFVPNSVAKPVPAYLLIDNRGPENTDPDRKVKSEFWPAEEIIATVAMLLPFSVMPMSIRIILMISKTGCMVCSTGEYVSPIPGAQLQPGPGVQAGVWIILRLTGI